MNISFIPILFLKCYSQRSQKLHNNFYALYLFLPPLVPNVGYLGFFFPHIYPSCKTMNLRARIVSSSSLQTASSLAQFVLLMNVEWM